MEKNNNDFSRWRTVQTFKGWAFKALVTEVFFVALSPTLAIIALLLGTVFWLIAWRMDREHTIIRLPMDSALLLFITMAGLSVMVSPDKFFSLYNFVCLLGVYAVSYLLMGQLVDNENKVKTIFKALGLSAALVVLYGFYQYAFGIDISEMKWVDGNAFPELKKRVFSTWQNPNILAGYLDEAICVAFAFLVELKDKKFKGLAAICIGMLVACLAMTYARGACLALGVVIALYGVLRDWRVLIGLVIVAGLVLFSDAALMDRLVSVFTKIDTSSEMRIAMWESTIEMILDHPFLGIGWGSYWMVYPMYDFYINDPSIKIYHAHNMYLNYAAETGLIGALAFFTYFFGSIRIVWKRLDESCSDFIRSLRLGLGLAILSVAICGFTDHVAFNIPTSMLLWGLCALSAATAKLEKPEEVCNFEGIEDGLQEEIRLALIAAKERKAETDNQKGDEERGIDQVKISVDVEQVEDEAGDKKVENCADDEKLN